MWKCVVNFRSQKGSESKKFRETLHYKNKQRFESRGIKRRTGLHTLADSRRILPLASWAQWHKVPPQRQWYYIHLLGVMDQSTDLFNAAARSPDLANNQVIKWDLMFCRPCIIVYQYSETNVIHILFNLLRIKGLYMFPALLAYPQKTLNKRHLVFCSLDLAVSKETARL
jgi:hypothetical protein